MNSTKSQVELESPAKVYQIEALSTQLSGIELLIKTQSETYVTKAQLDLAMEVRDNKIKTLNDKIKSWSRAGWIVGSTVLALVVNQVWQTVINQGRVG